jgi:hypothetical protein
MFRPKNILKVSFKLESRFLWFKKSPWYWISYHIKSTCLEVYVFSHRANPISINCSTEITRSFQLHTAIRGGGEIGGRASREQQQETRWRCFDLETPLRDENPLKVFRSMCDDNWVNELKIHWYILILILFSKGHHNDMKEGLFISKLIDYINSGPTHASQAFV